MYVSSGFTFDKLVSSSLILSCLDCRISVSIVHALFCSDVLFDCYIVFAEVVSCLKLLYWSRKASYKCFKYIWHNLC